MTAVQQKRAEVKLKSALTKLGRTEKQIAAAFKARHIKGTRRAAEFCPFAIYVKRQFRNAVAAYAAAAWLKVIFDAHGDLHVSVELTDTQRDFMTSFDDGAYPELEVTLNASR